MASHDKESSSHARGQIDALGVFQTDQAVQANPWRPRWPRICKPPRHRILVRCILLGHLGHISSRRSKGLFTARASSSRCCSMRGKLQSKKPSTSSRTHVHGYSAFVRLDGLGCDGRACRFGALACFQQAATNRRQTSRLENSTTLMMDSGKIEGGPLTTQGA